MRCCWQYCCPFYYLLLSKTGRDIILIIRQKGWRRREIISAHQLVLYKQFEELWQGSSISLTAECWKEPMKNWEEAPILSCWESVGPQASFSMEDCFLDQTDMLQAFLMEPRLKQESQSLFNELNDHKYDINAEDTLSPSSSTAKSNDGLPVTEDSWSLLREFEDFSKQEEATPLHNCDMNTDNLVLGDIVDDMDITEYLPFDLMLPENECNVNVEEFMENVNHLDIKSDAPDTDELTEVQISQETSTSNLLAELISQTLIDPSLGGLLSSTTLDISTVFGQLTKTSGNLLSNESSSVDNLVTSVRAVKNETVDMDVVTAAIESVPSTSCSQFQDEKKDGNKKRNATSPLRTKKSLEERYLEMRNKNNEASRKSRMLRKQKRQSLAQQEIQLQEDNKKLRQKAEELENLVRTLKTVFVKQINGVTIK